MENAYQAWRREFAVGDAATACADTTENYRRYMHDAMVEQKTVTAGASGEQIIARMRAMAEGREWDVTTPVSISNVQVTGDTATLMADNTRGTFGVTLKRVNERWLVAAED